MNKLNNKDYISDTIKQTMKVAKVYYGTKTPIQQIYVPKADKNFVIAFQCDPRFDRNCQLSLLDDPNSVHDPVSVIRYDINNSKIHIQYFKTRYDYQGTGLGKFLYQLAQAHADKLGIKFSDGLICPVDDIKGVSKPNSPDYEKEYKFLTLMYHALGNKIVQRHESYGTLLFFEDNWKTGQKIDKLNSDQKEFLKEFTNYELAQYQKCNDSKNKNEKDR